MPNTYEIEVTGWDSFGEWVEDAVTVTAENEDAAVEHLIGRMRVMWGLTEVGDVRARTVAA